MIAATVASFIPSLFPTDQKKERTKEVITQSGADYFRRQTWRTRGKDVYQNIPQEDKIIPYKKYLMYGGFALAALLILKVIMKKKRVKQ